MCGFHNRLIAYLISIVAILCLSVVASAQSSTFTYQGRLTDGGSPANGNYDLQFTLWDALSGGNQLPVGSPILLTRTGVSVANGVFTTQLDFTTPAFPGADRYLEISVKHPADSSYTTLAPRTQLTSTPYAIRTLSAVAADTATNATQLGGVPASQYVQTNDSRLSDARPASSVDFNTATLSGLLLTPRGGTGLGASGASGNFLRSDGSIWTSAPISASDVPAGSGNYIRNTTTQQPASFNVNGSGTVGGALTAASVASNGTSNLAFNAQSPSTIGTWLRLNNTSLGGHSWNLISTGSGNGEGSGKLLFNDQTSGGTRMQMDGTGVTVNGNLTVTDLTVTGTLTATVTTENFATLPHCKVSQTSAQQFANGLFVKVQFDNAQFCSGVTFDNANNQLVIVTAGLYQVTGELLFSANGTGVRAMTLDSNAGELAGTSHNAVGGFTHYLNATSLVRLNVGQTISMTGAQDSGAPLFAEVFGGRAASLSVNWVGP